MVKDYLIIIYISTMVMLIILQKVRIERLKKHSENMDKIKKDIYILCENVSKASSKEEVYFLILDAAIRAINKADKGSILILEEDGEFHFKATRGYQEEINKISLKKEEVHLYILNKFKDTAIINDPKKFSSIRMQQETLEKLKELDALEVSSTLASPIYVDEQLIGVINIDISSKDKIFDEEDVGLLKHMKYELELAVRNFLAQDKLKYIATHDELTKLYNRRSFKDSMQKELKNIKLKRYNSCLALIDIDNFKFINDNYGHNIGDKALIIFSDTLTRNVTYNDICFRMSGDEFLVLFVNKTEEEAACLLESIRSILKSSDVVLGGITFSYGICSITYENALSLDEILSVADKNMYKNKKCNKC